MADNRMRQHRTGAQKTELVLLTLAGQSIGALGREYAVNPTLLCRWRADFITAGANRLASPTERDEAERAEIDRLHSQVEELERALGRKTMELDRVSQDRGERA